MTAGFFQDETLPKLRQIVDLNVRAVVDLTHRFLPGHARARPRRRAQHRLGRGLHAGAVSGDLRRHQGVRCSRSAGRCPTRPWAPACASRWSRRGRSTRPCTPRPAPQHSRYVAYLPVMSAEDAGARRPIAVQARQEGDRDRLVQPLQRLRLSLCTRFHAPAVHGNAVQGADAEGYWANAGAVARTRDLWAAKHRQQGANRSLSGMVEPDGIEPTTSAVRLLRSPN